MTKFGYTLYCEGNDPRSLIDQAVMAEAAGFDFVVISDHYHPWLPNQEHSAFAWSVLGAVAQATKRIHLATMVTCPIVRYHPALVAQMAATLGVISQGRFTLGLGSGERLNEHVVGMGWPAIDVRHRMLREAIDIIQALWSGKYVSHYGEFFSVEDARVFDLPEDPIDLFVAAGGPRAARLAADAGGGLCFTDPEKSLVDAYLKHGGDKDNLWSQVTLAWGTDKKKAAQELYDNFRFSVGGWKVQAELPNPINFEAATKLVKPEDMQRDAGPDVALHAKKVQEYIKLGVTHVSMAYPGSDHQGFMAFWQNDLKPAITASTKRAR